MNRNVHGAFQDGYLSALPYLVMFVMIFPVSRLAQELVNRDLISTQMQRKLFNSLGSYGAAAGLVWLSFIRCNVALAVVGISVVVGLQSFIIPGCMVSYAHTHSQSLSFH